MEAEYKFSYSTETHYGLNGSVSKSDAELDSQITVATQNALMIGSTDIEMPKNSLLGINFLQTV